MNANCTANLMYNNRSTAAERLCKLISEPKPARYRGDCQSTCRAIQAICILLLISSALTIAQGFKQQSWPSVIAHMTSGHPELYTYRQNRNKIRQYYAIDAVFNFKVKGKTYTHEHTFGDWKSLEEASSELARGLKVKRKLTLWFNPADPAQVDATPAKAYVSTGACTGVLSTIILLVATAVAVLNRAWKSRQNA